MLDTLESLWSGTRVWRLLCEAEAALGNANEVLQKHHHQMADEVYQKWAKSIDSYIERFPDQKDGFLEAKADAETLAYAFRQSTYDMSYTQQLDLANLSVVAARRLREMVAATTMEAAECKALDGEIDDVLIVLQSEAKRLYSIGSSINREFEFARKALLDGNAAKACTIADKLRQRIGTLITT